MIAYVTREIERALGIVPSERYLIITNHTPYGESIQQQYPDFVTLVDSPAAPAASVGALLGTGDLLAHPATAEIIARTGASVLVFKNTARIEPIVRGHGWKLLNPPAAVSEKIENKLSQVAWLGELASYLPPHRLQTAKDIQWRGVPFVTQWAHGHTGGGTMLVDSEATLRAIQAKFPERRTRVTDYIQGPSFTVNVAVSPDMIAPGNVSYQITGLPPFTDSPFATVGNDWGAARSMLSAGELRTIRETITKLGAKMAKGSWRGLFGIDLIRDARTGRLYLIEINARQPASSTFESSLQMSARAAGATGMTIFEAHIAALLGEPLQPIITIKDGAQIVQRVTSAVKSAPASAAEPLAAAGYETVSYTNTEPNADLLRIQSAHAIMAGHNEFNRHGKEIVRIITDK